ncbi:hypothetical protein F2Q69_00036585 [Brassica cretica]|uniref:ATP-dependent RNA helicase Ski2/MTR4 C-terminal domain-containing protein n=1 Tax=Brassica cretica TaxID=69181 RepID=A0A8S9SD61_BRACR|nr:hypothetical protein F2Q69_00036585 [Brassica cretica]
MLDSYQTSRISREPIADFTSTRIRKKSRQENDSRAVCLDCPNDNGEQQSFSIEDQDAWGVIMKFNKVKSLSEDDNNRRPEDANYTVDVLTRCLVSRDGAGKKKIKPVPFKERGEPVVVSVPLSQIHHKRQCCGVEGKGSLNPEKNSTYSSYSYKIQPGVMLKFSLTARPDIMEAVYAWAKGSKFYEIVEIARVFEGSLIRAIRRMEEVLQQLIVSCKIHR